MGLTFKSRPVPISSCDNCAKIQLQNASELPNLTAADISGRGLVRMLTDGKVHTTAHVKLDADRSCRVGHLTGRKYSPGVRWN